MEFLFLFMVVVFCTYVTCIGLKYGILPSISESYYVLPKNYKPLFTLFCWAFAFPAIILGSTPLMFFAGAGICFVGAAAAFKEKMTKEVHYGGAMVGIICSQLSIGLDFHFYYINAFFIITAALIILLKKYLSNTTWWIEIDAFISICMAIGSKIFL